MPAKPLLTKPQVKSVAKEMERHANIKADIAHLKKADHIYFNTDKDLLMSDEEYDILYKHTQKLCERFGVDDGGYFKSVGAPQVSREAVKLPIPMPGLKKITPAEIPAEMVSRGLNTTGMANVDLKIDGVSGTVIYHDAILHSAFSRGDDQNGRNITAHVKNITGVPHRIEYFNSDFACGARAAATHGVFAVRGEFVIPKQTFDNLKKKGQLVVNKGKSTEKEYSNPRMMVSALLLRQEPSPLLKYVVFVPFSVEESANPVTVLEAAQELENIFEWPVERKTISANLLQDASYIVNLIKNMRAHSEFNCDGIVVAFEGAQASMRHAQRFAVKLDKSEQVKINSQRTVVTKVEINMSSRNMAKPIVHVEPVMIDGVKHTSFTGNNMREIEQYQIGPGSQVTVIRAGDVIPHIVKGEGKNAITPSRSFKKITRCPDCGHSLKWTYTSQGAQGADMYCGDELCLQSKHSINFFLKLEAMDVGESNLRSIINELGAGKESVADILESEPVFTEVLGKTLGPKTYKSLLKSLECDHARVMYASGCFSRGTVNLGEATIRKFLSRLKITPADLLELETKKIEEILQPFCMSETEKVFATAMPVFANFYDTIIDWHLPPKMTDKWRGRVYSFTGFRDDGGKKAIVERGGEYSDSVTKRTTHLVYAEASGKKYDKAKEQKVHLLTVREFEDSL